MIFFLSILYHRLILESDCKRGNDKKDITFPVGGGMFPRRSGKATRVILHKLAAGFHG